MNPATSPATLSRVLTVGAAAVIGVSVIGFFVGTRPPAIPEPVGVALASAGIAAKAPTYRELRGDRSRWGAAQRTASAELSALAPRTPPEGTEMPKASDAELGQALALRAARRAYEGAPPTVPHPVTERGALACLACHERGVQVGALRAAPIPHAPFASCTQCHVTDAGPVEPSLALTLGMSEFVGLEAPRGGERAWEGAPPVLPHPTHMREQCSACHGPGGQQALRTSHPWRQSCTQCHAPGASYDQRPLARVEAVPAWEASR
jgi:cytochrome c-type protein NapB